MKKAFLKILLLGVALASLACPINTYADEEEAKPDDTQSATSISLTPVSKIFQIASSSTYDNKINIKNDGSSSIKVEVYAAPYSYVYSEEEDLYKLGFSNESKFTQISRWITFKDASGNYVERPVFTIPGGESLDVDYRITTPSSIPSGGQYAVIFAHTLSTSTSRSGIRTEASPGMVVYGRSTEGETIVSSEISNLEIGQGITENDTTRNSIYGTAKIKNTGNVDFNAKGVLKVDPIIGFSSYETPSMAGILSVIPEAELTLSEEWKETPSFGLYKVTWTVTVNDKVETTERLIFLISPLTVIITIILLTILTIWIIIQVRRRKERRSRLAV